MEIAAQLNRHEQTSPKRVVGRPFAKGVSGNAKGRPRKAVTAAEIRRIARGSIHEMVRAAAFAPVQVEIDGELVEITALEAGMREVAMQAARGDRLALLALTRLLASTAVEAAEAEAAEAQAQEAPHVRLDRAEMLAARRKQLELAESPEAEAAVPPAPAPEPETVTEADASPAPETAEAATCRHIRMRALAAGGTAVAPPDDGASVAGLRCWLATLNQDWDKLEYDWACTRLQTVRDALERRQQQVGRARAAVEQGLAEWDAAASCPGASSAA